MNKAYTLEQAGEMREFPMLHALHVLTLSLSNSAQSATSCASVYTAEKWAGIESTLARMPAHEFVEMALTLDEDDTIMARYFPGWALEWV